MTPFRIESDTCSLLNARSIAGVAQWQSAGFPNRRRRFDSFPPALSFVSVEEIFRPVPQIEHKKLKMNLPASVEERLATIFA
jgi:hypothetical protein